jgi:hypothetical protein
MDADTKVVLAACRSPALLIKVTFEGHAHVLPMDEARRCVWEALNNPAARVRRVGREHDSSTSMQQHKAAVMQKGKCATAAQGLNKVKEGEAAEFQACARAAARD